MIPAGLSAAGLPIGIQLIGCQYSESALYRAARVFELEKEDPLEIQIQGTVFAD